jgi:AcrR family transcriptional regulator
MPSLATNPNSGAPATGVREAQRLETRARLFDAAVAEVGRSGLAGTDVSAVASAAGVSRGTFYFHFPTKEHVIVELERAEEAKIVARLGPRTGQHDDLVSVLSQLVRHVLAAERRLGPVVFREMLSLHFSPARPVDDELAAHPLAGFVIERITQAQAAGRVAADGDPGHLGVIFMTGLFALLATGTTSASARNAMLHTYVTTLVRGMET